MNDYSKAALEGLKIAWDYLKGKKTYFAGVAGIIYAIIQADKEIFIVSLGLLGLRHGISSEISKLLK